MSYLVAHPRASLEQIAAAAGMGRTSLFKRFPTRSALAHAVALRALTVCHDAVAGASDAAGLVLETLLGGVGARSAPRAMGAAGSVLVATSAVVS